MARPRTPVGGYGRINTRCLRRKDKHGPAVWEAFARFRLRTGKLKPVTRTGPTETAAVNTLKRRLAELADEATGKRVKPATRMTVIMDLWLEECEREVAAGHMAHGTLGAYRGKVNNWIRPRLGELTAVEAEEDPGLSNDVIQSGRQQSYETAKQIRTVLRQAYAFAIRHGAMTANPVDSAKGLSTDEEHEVIALAPERRRRLIDDLRTYGEGKTHDGQGRRLGPRQQSWLDLADLAEAGMSTGGRIGEALAVIGEDVDTERAEITLGHHIVRVPGRGLVRKPKRKGKGRALVLTVPQWSLPMWRRRKLAAAPGAPLFPSWTDPAKWQDPSGVTKLLRRACDDLDYNEVTSHIWRRTVGTHLGASGHSGIEIGDQLGNTPAVAEKHYRGKGAANEKTAHSLESIFDNDTGTGS